MELPARHGHVWLRWEDEALLRFIRQQVSTYLIMTQLQRTEEALRARLELLANTHLTRPILFLNMTIARRWIQAQASGYTDRTIAAKWGTQLDAPVKQKEPTVAAGKFHIVAASGVHRLDYATAVKLAERYAKESPDSTFFIMEAIEEVAVQQPTVIRTPIKASRKRK